MPFLIVIALSILPLLIAAACLFMLNRLRTRRRRSNLRSKRKPRFGFYPVAAANALQVLQEIVHPKVRHTIELRSDDQSDEDDASDPNDPMQHLHRQAARIRRGEPIDRLTALLPSKPSTPAPPS